MGFCSKDKLRGLWSALELPMSIIEGDLNIEIHGNKEAIFEGHISVIEYSDTVIRLNTGKGVVRICGSDLEITTLNPDLAILQGVIAGLDFSD